MAMKKERKLAMQAFLLKTRKTWPKENDYGDWARYIHELVAAGLYSPKTAYIDVKRIVKRMMAEL